MKTTDFVEQWYSMQMQQMQKAFLPPPEILASSRENAFRFWENQERILDNMQAFANGWFERRHMGALSACKAAERMCGTESIVGLIQVYQDWVRGTFERIMADGLSCQQQIFAATSALTSPPLAPSVNEKKEAEPVRSEPKVPSSSKAA
jgi:hypothetical protein